MKLNGICVGIFSSSALVLAIGAGGPPGSFVVQVRLGHWSVEASQAVPKPAPNTPVYDVPAGFADARAEAVIIAKTTSIGNAHPLSVSFNSDGTKFVYGPTGYRGRRGLLTLKDTRTLLTIKTIDVTDSARAGCSTCNELITNTAWSPDQRRIAFATSGSLGIVEIDSGKIYELPEGRGGTGSTLMWQDTSAIHIDGLVLGHMVALDLDTMKLTEVAAAERERILKSMSRHKNIDIQRMGFGGSAFFVAMNQDRSFSRILSNDAAGYWSVSPDRSRMIVHGGEAAEMWVLGTRVIPRLQFRLVFGAGALTDSARTVLAGHLKNGRPVWGRVYVPEVNPLNGRVLGPKKDASKSIVRIIALEGDTGAVTIAVEAGSTDPGDIVSDICGGGSIWPDNFWFGPESALKGLWGILAIPGDSKPQQSTPANLRMEPTRPSPRAIMSPRRAAHSQR